MTVRCEQKRLTLDLAGKQRNIYHCRVPVSHTIEDVLNPDYFGLLMSNNQLTVGDRIYCEWEDFSCMFDLIVLAQSPSVTQLICRAVTEIVKFGDMDFPKDWEAKWQGDAEKYGIFYKGALKEQGFLTKESALTRINAIIALDMQKAAGSAANRAMLDKRAEPAKPGRRPKEEAPAETGTEAA